MTTNAPTLLRPDMACRIVEGTWKSGERYRMLIEAETGMPTWWPTLFVTAQLKE